MCLLLVVHFMFTCVYNTVCWLHSNKLKIIAFAIVVLVAIHLTTISTLHTFTVHDWIGFMMGLVVLYIVYKEYIGVANAVMWIYDHLTIIVASNAMLLLVVVIAFNNLRIYSSYWY